MDKCVLLKQVIPSYVIQILFIEETDKQIATIAFNVVIINIWRLQILILIQNMLWQTHTQSLPSAKKL